MPGPVSVNVEKEVLDGFARLRIGAGRPTQLGLILSINTTDDKVGLTHVVADCGKGSMGSRPNWDAVLAQLPEHEARFVAYNFKGTLAPEPGNMHGQEFEKLILVTWFPDTVPARQKLLFNQSKQYLLDAFDGIKSTVVATEMDELSYVEVFKAITGGKVPDGTAPAPAPVSPIKTSEVRHHAIEEALAAEEQRELEAVEAAKAAQDAARKAAVAEEAALQQAEEDASAAALQAAEDEAAEAEAEAAALTTEAEAAAAEAAAVGAEAAALAAAGGK